MPQQIPLKQAAKMIPNKSSIFIGGFAHIRACMAFSRELIRQKKHDLYFVSSGPTVHVDLLAAGHVINFMEVAYSGIETIGPAPNVRRRIEEGFLKVEDYSNFSMTMRLYGGAMGVPFMPVRSMLGSDLEYKSSFKNIEDKLMVVECPFTKSPVCLVPSLNPDFGIIQVQRVDEEGNVQIDDVAASDVDGIKASEIKIVLAEEIVPSSVIRKDPKRTEVPGLMVDYIVHVPWGAWPTGMFNYYDYDQDHIEKYVSMCETEEGWQKYKQEWVLPSEEEILKKIGEKRLGKLKARKNLGY
jgi:glutaconate CoA-transferase subunit A